MFRKEVIVKSNVKLKSSDKKKFAANLLTNYSEIKTDINLKNDEVAVLKVTTNDGRRLEVYTVNNDPWIFIDEDRWYPTDLMLPGLIFDGELSPKKLGNLPKGAPCSVSVIENRAPIAVGKTNISSLDMFECGMRGKGVQILHIFGDFLWKMGSKEPIPYIPWVKKEEMKLELATTIPKDEEDKLKNLDINVSSVWTEKPETVIPSEPVGESVMPSEPIEESVMPSEPIEESVMPSEPVGESVLPSEPVWESVIPSEPVGKSVIPSEPVEESVIPSESIRKSTRPSERIGKSVKPSEPVGKSVKTSEPVAKSVETSESVWESVIPSEPVRKSVIPSEPVGESTVPSEERVGKSVDDRFKDYFLSAIKQKMSPKQFPILASTFLGSVLLPFMDECGGERINVKDTSYKKFSTFLTSIKEEGIIDIEEKQKGIQFISAVRFNHQAFSNLELLKNNLPPPSCSSKSDKKSTTSSSEFKEMFSISAAVLILIRQSRPNAKKGDPISASDFRTIITDYVKSRQLQNGPTVKLDDLLIQCLNIGGALKTDKEMSWDVLFRNLFSKMQPCYEFQFSDGQSGLKKGKPPNVVISVARRAGNKKVTLINNLEGLGVEPGPFAKELQIAAAASATLNEVPSSVGPQVQVQGDNTELVIKFLVDKYNVSKKMIKLV